jgi:hypothetical protein
MSRLLDLQHKIQDTNAMIAKIERSVSEHPAPSLLANLRSLQRRVEMLESDFAVLADRRSQDVCSYRMFSKGERYKVSSFAKALADFQATFTLTYDALKNGPKQRATVNPEVEAATAFDFGYAFAGSVGVMMTLENERLLIGQTHLDEAMSVVFAMAKAASAEEIAMFAKRLGPPPVRALYRWATAHVVGDMGAEIEWRKERSLQAGILVQQPELERLREAIAATSEETTEQHTFTGTLQGLDIVTRRFRLERPNGEEIVGSTGDVVGPGHSVPIPSTQTVRLELKTKVHYSIDKEDRIWRLLAFVNQ